MSIDCVMNSYLLFFFNLVITNTIHLLIILKYINLY